MNIPSTGTVGISIKLVVLTDNLWYAGCHSSLTLLTMSSSSAAASQVICSYEFNGIYSRNSVLYPMTSQNDLFCLRNTHGMYFDQLEPNVKNLIRCLSIELIVYRFLILSKVSIGHTLFHVLLSNGHGRVFQQFSESESIDSDYELTEYVLPVGYDHADGWNVREYGDLAHYF